jgi:hypothetical protein
VPVPTVRDNLHPVGIDEPGDPAGELIQRSSAFLFG